MKKLVLPVLSLILILGMITACGEGESKDAKTLASDNKTAQEEVKNYHVEGTMDMEMKMTMNASGQSQDLEMPAKMETSMDTDQKTAHGQTKTDVTFMGQSQSEETEIYADLENGTTYTRTGSSGAWTKGSQEIDVAPMMDSLSSMQESLLEKAEVTHGNGSYSLTLTGDALGEALKDMDLSGVTQGMDLGDLQVGSGSVVYTINEESSLVESVKMEGISITTKGTASGVDYDAAITMNADYTYSKYNELKPEDYAIPAEVIGGDDSAKKASSTEAPTTAATKATTKEPSTAPTSPGGGAETQLTVSGASTPDDQGWYVVGQDFIPEGTYRLFHGQGQGVLKLTTSEHRTLGDYSIGFGEASAGREMPDGTQVTLEAGDLVFITEELEVVFDPVH